MVWQNQTSFSDGCPEKKVIELLNSSSFDNIDLDILQGLVAEKEKKMKEKEILSNYRITKLSNGRFMCRIDGVQISSKNKEKLEQKIIKFVESLNDPCKNATIESIFDMFLEVRKRTVAETTWAYDLKYKRFFLEGSEIFKKPLKKLTPNDAYDFFDHVKRVKAELSLDPKSRVTRELKQKYWTNLRGFMNSVLEYAIACRYCDYNPFKNMAIHSDAFAPAKKTSVSDSVFSDEELYRVCALAEKDSEETHDALPLAIPLLFQLGLRDGEIVAIQWGDIDGIWLHVQRELSGITTEEGFVRGRCIKPRCKTAASVRFVELSKDARILLSRIKSLNAAKGYPVGPCDFVFYRVVNGSITTCTERCFAGRLSKYCKQAGMVICKSPHDARRTCLTNMYRNGISLAYIQKFAGHESEKQTEKYLKLTTKDMVQNENTSCLNMDHSKLSAYKNADFREKIILMQKKA